MLKQMISYIQAENISKSFGDNNLFEDLSFGISEGQRVALIARNGTENHAAKYPCRKR